MYKSKTYKTGYRLALVIAVEQHSRDELLMNNLINKLGCGYTFKNSKRNSVSFRVTKFDDINKKIIPLFKEYKIKGIKSLDYEDFCLAAEIIKRRDHVKLKGLEEIKQIKAQMNKARYISMGYI
jgi:hypothetical protein